MTDTIDLGHDLYPTSDGIAALRRTFGDGPVVMLNLLRFRTHAQYGPDTPADLDTEVSGMTAYQRYGATMLPIVEAGGGRLLFSGRPEALMIGHGTLPWHAVALVEYPGVDAFVRIVSQAEVMAIAHHRAAGLEGQLLIAVRQGAGIG